MREVFMKLVKQGSLQNINTQKQIIKKVKDLIISKGYNINKINAWYYKATSDNIVFERIYRATIYFRLNSEINNLSFAQRAEIKNLYISFLKKEGFIPNEIDKVAIFFDSEEISEFFNKDIALKAKSLLVNNGYPVFKILDSYDRQSMLYMAFIYFKSDEELKNLSLKTKNAIKELYNGLLLKEKCIPEEISKTIFYFDSDENVQKHYQGNYFYSTK